MISYGIIAQHKLTMLKVLLQKPCCTDRAVLQQHACGDEDCCNSAYFKLQKHK